VIVENRWRIPFKLGRWVICGTADVGEIRLHHLFLRGRHD
jgi:hypothetical protein